MFQSWQRAYTHFEKYAHRMILSSTDLTGYSTCLCHSSKLAWARIVHQDIATALQCIIIIFNVVTHGNKTNFQSVCIHFDRIRLSTVDFKTNKMVMVGDAITTKMATSVEKRWMKKTTTSKQENHLLMTFMPMTQPDAHLIHTHCTI